MTPLEEEDDDSDPDSEPDPDPSSEAELSDELYAYKGIVELES